MIQANELRIGNWVLVNDKPMIINTVHYEPLVQRCSVNVVDKLGGIPAKVISEIYPIPLTEGILLRCGFRKQGNNIWVFINNEKYIIEYMLEEFIFRVVTDRYNSTFLRVLKYLHQLQNLYFALTGKELEVKLI